MWLGKNNYQTYIKHTEYLMLVSSISYIKDVSCFSFLSVIFLLISKIPFKNSNIEYFVSNAQSVDYVMEKSPNRGQTKNSESRQEAKEDLGEIFFLFHFWFLTANFFVFAFFYILDLIETKIVKFCICQKKLKYFKCLQKI